MKPKINANRLRQSEFRRHLATQPQTASDDGTRDRSLREPLNNNSISNRYTERAAGERSDNTADRQSVRQETETSTNQLAGVEGWESVSKKLRQFQAATGDEFDKLYIQTMARDHEKSLKEFERASQQLTDPELKQFASDTPCRIRSF